MKIGMIAPPWLRIYPGKTGGIENVICNLNRELTKLDIQVVLFSVGTSQTVGEKRYLFSDGIPNSHEFYELNHLTYCFKESSDVDLIHLHCDLGIPLTHFTDKPVVHTFHNPATNELIDMIRYFPEIQYVCISENQRNRFQQQCEDLKMSCIHHGIDLSQYPFQETKKDYLCYLGRIAPEKGVRQAIEVSRSSGIPLKIAGPNIDVDCYRHPFRDDDYFQRIIEPMIDGTFVEYLGEIGFEEKVELLKGSLGLLFPVEWEEPFGLVMIEAMACGTPILALRKGSVPEIICHGVTGYIANDIKEFEEYIPRLKDISPTACRDWVSHHFSLERMVHDYIKLYSQILGEKTIKEVRPLLAIPNLVSTI